MTDGEAEQLLRAIYPSLRRFAAVVGPAECEPDDLVQEAVLAVLSATDLMELDYPTAYLRRAILNSASNHRRRLGRARTALAKVVPSFASLDQYPSDLAPLFSLSPTARAVMYLHHVEGRSYAEISTALGVSESHARVIATRARRKLRREHAEEPQ